MKRREGNYGREREGISEEKGDFKKGNGDSLKGR